MFLKNNATVDIIDYPVDGETFTIPSGKVTEVPDAVGELLLRRYGDPKFLTEYKSDVASVVEKTEVKEEVKVETPEIVQKYTRAELEEMKYKKLQELYKANTGKGTILSKENYIEHLLSI